MTPHWHASIDNVIVYGVSAIIVFNVVRIGAGWMVKRGGTTARIGEAIGGLV